MQRSSSPLALGSAALLACTEGTPPPQRAEAARAPVPAAAAPARRDSTWVEITGPTLIAFFPPDVSAQIDAGGDEATALDDFGHHLASATDSLRALGVRVVGVGTRTLHVVQDGRTNVFAVPRDSADLGYYLVAPGRPPLVQYGVLSDTDLVDVAQEYLRGARTPR